MLSWPELLLMIGIGALGVILTRMGARIWLRGRTLPGAWRPFRETGPLLRRRPWLRRYWMAVSMMASTCSVALLLVLVAAMPPKPSLARLALVVPCFLALYYTDLLTGQLNAQRERLKRERERRRVARRIKGGGGTVRTAAEERHVRPVPEQAAQQSRTI